MGRPKKDAAVEAETKKLTPEEKHLLSPGRLFSVILYPDSENQDVELTLRCLETFFSDWYYIYHDRDIQYDENGNQIGIKKGHYHIVACKSNPSRIGVVSHQLHVPPNQIRLLHKKDYAVRYLCHLDDKDKVTYGIDEVISCSPDLVRHYCSKNTEELKVECLMAYIDRTVDFRITAMAEFAYKNNCWSEFRRAYSIWTRMLMEKEGIFYESNGNRGNR